MPVRTPIEVAKRAIVMGAVAMRASLEVTDDPRAAQVASQLPGWLGELELQSAIEQIESEILHTPFGQLDKSQCIDAGWSGEGAAFFCWTLGIGEQLPRFRKADHASAINTLGVLRPESRDVLSAASLRSEPELREFCKHVHLRQALLRETQIKTCNLGDKERELATSIVREMAVAKLLAMGVEAKENDFHKAGLWVAEASPVERESAAGVYVARQIAAAWLFDSREGYFREP